MRKRLRILCLLSIFCLPMGLAQANFGVNLFGSLNSGGCGGNNLGFSNSATGDGDSSASDASFTDGPVDLPLPVAKSINGVDPSSISFDAPGSSSINLAIQKSTTSGTLNFSLKDTSEDKTVILGRSGSEIDRTTTSGGSGSFSISENLLNKILTLQTVDEVDGSEVGSFPVSVVIDEEGSLTVSLTNTSSLTTGSKLLFDEENNIYFTYENDEGSHCVGMISADGGDPSEYLCLGETQIILKDISTTGIIVGLDSQSRQIVIDDDLNAYLDTQTDAVTTNREMKMNPNHNMVASTVNHDGRLVIMVDDFDDSNNPYFITSSEDCANPESIYFDWLINYQDITKEHLIVHMNCSSGPNKILLYENVDAAIDGSDSEEQVVSATATNSTETLGLIDANDNEDGYYFGIADSEAYLYAFIPDSVDTDVTGTSAERITMSTYDDSVVSIVESSGQLKMITETGSETTIGNGSRPSFNLEGNQFAYYCTLEGVDQICLLSDNNGLSFISGGDTNTPFNIAGNEGSAVSYHYDSITDVHYLLTQTGGGFEVHIVDDTGAIESSFSNNTSDSDQQNVTPYDITVDSTGDIYVCGVQDNSGGGSGDDFWVGKYDATTQILEWTYVEDAISGEDACNAIGVWGTTLVTTGQSEVVTSQYDIRTVRLDMDTGALLWGHYSSCAFDGKGRDIAHVDSVPAIVVVGMCNNGDPAAYIESLNVSTGAQYWGSSYNNGTGTDVMTGVIVDNGNSIISVGYDASNIVYMWSHQATTGTFRWVETPVTMNDTPFGAHLAVDSSDTLYLAVGGDNGTTDIMRWLAFSYNNSGATEIDTNTFTDLDTSVTNVGNTIGINSTDDVNLFYNDIDTGKWLLIDYSLAP